MVDLESYKQKVDEIRKYASDNNIPESEVNKVFEECFQILEITYQNQKKTSHHQKTNYLKYSLIATLTSIIVAIVSFNHPPTMSLVMRNSQNFIYPGMKFLRQLAVPILTRYPSLTEWYDEWCLLENPYFRVADMDCRPCASINSVLDLTGLNVSSSMNIGMPFTRSETAEEIGLKDIATMYERNEEVFDEDAWRVTSNNKSYSTINDVAAKRLDLNPTRLKTTRITWKITRMKPSRLLRKLLPRPSAVPEWWGQSTERFVIIDESKSPAHVLPNPECSNVIMRCVSGERMIRLVPSPECQQECKSWTVLLTARQELWYNWWYWRPVSLPASNSTSLSISYLISFC